MRGRLAARPAIRGVLMHDKVSSRHALISFRDGVFFIQDISRNGVSLNSPDNRLDCERPYALKAGDVIFIEPYEIDVSVETRPERQAFPPLAEDDPSARPPSVDVGDTSPQNAAPLLGPRSAATALPAAASPGLAWGLIDLANVLEGAGLPSAQVTPELAQEFGQMLRVVVAGLIDLLQGRWRIKEEFRMRQTVFHPTTNNPLKFSANVEDALHNLLVKRNPAYLGAVDALADAFDDLRDHQLATLTGMRGAFEAMRAEFDPDGTRLKMTKERGDAFARFEEEFARAYQVQFQKLRVQRRARGEEAPHAPATPIPAGYDPLSLSEDAIAPPEADPHVRTDDPTSRELDGSAGPLKKGVVGRAADVTATVVSAMAGALGFLRRKKDCSEESDTVKCSVFAPATVKKGADVLIQVFAHVPGDAAQVRTLAEAFDNRTSGRAAKLLDQQVQRGAALTFSLSMPGIPIADPTQSLVWRGIPDAVQFVAHIPPTHRDGSLIGTVLVCQDTVPFGHLKFILEVVAHETGERDQPSAAAQAWKRYRHAFISYASSDRAEVLKRVQMLDRTGIDYFQDLLSLDPGERWARTLYRKIDESDVFFLFWSTAAKKSEWVMKEVRYAMERHAGDEMAPPEIVPVLIEGPPPVPPPPELKGLHFNDKFLYFIAGSP